jgi:hypothetical protein
MADSIRRLEKLLNEEFKKKKKPEDDLLPNRFLKCIKDMETGSSKVSTWSLSIVGGSLLALISDSYVHPSCLRFKLGYLLFLLGWLFLGVSLYNSLLISRSAIAANLHEKELVELTKIFKNCNCFFRRQLKHFQLGLLVFGAWLALYLCWWVFTVLPIKK